MNINIYKGLFKQFCSSFIKNDDTGAYALKFKHSFEVLKNAESIAKSIELNPKITELVQAAALFHDVGRFPQFAKYQTFNDHQSEDHAELSVKTIVQNKFISTLTAKNQQIIITAIKLHNKFSISNVSLENDEQLVAKIIRDADKLDIYRIMTEKIAQECNTTPAAFQNRSDAPHYSDKIKQSILDNRLARFEDVTTTCDFQLLQLTWIHDINFPFTLESIAKNYYIEKLIEQLPNKKTIEKEIEHITLKLTTDAIH